MEEKKDRMEGAPIKAKVLCVSNKDTDLGPLMLAVLKFFLKNARRTDVYCESAGIDDEVTECGKGASQFAIAAARKIGMIELESHRTRRVDFFNLKEEKFDIFVCSCRAVADRLIKMVAEPEKIVDMDLHEPAVDSQKQYCDQVMAPIFGVMYKKVIVPHF